MDMLLTELDEGELPIIAESAGRRLATSAGEHNLRCGPLDRAEIPLIGWLARLLTNN
jgi:hypothetical protein